MKKGFLSVGLFAGVFVLHSLNVDASIAKVYTDNNFSGRYLDLTTGKYEEEYVDKKNPWNWSKIIKNYNGAFIGNDTVNSVQVPLGYRLILTENNDYKGRTLSVENNYNNNFSYSINNTLNYQTVEASSINRLSDFSFNNKTSSIIFEDMKYDPVFPVVYEDSEFKKPSAPLQIGDYRKKQLPFGNDKISGIRVPKGYTVRMWDDDKYKDRNYTYVGPTNIPFLEGFNDKVSSMKIRRTGDPI